MKPTKRPFAVTCLIGLVLTLSGQQALRLWVTLSSWANLTSLPLTVSPAYFALTAIIWLALGAVLVWGLWRAKPWTPRAIKWAILAFFSVHWLDRIFLQVAGPQRTNWLFDLVLNFALAASVFALLALPKTRSYFGDTNE